VFVSKSKRFIFIHMPKTGGTSIHEALSPYFDHLNREDLRHASWERLPEFLPVPQIKAYTKVVAVRNPWAWLVSNYLMVLKSPSTPDYRRIVAMGFEEYVDYHLSESVFRIDDYLYCSQIRWWGMVPDVILRFESLNADFTRLCQQLGLEASLGHVNEGTFPRHYSAFYSDRLAKHVGRRLRGPIRKLGYRFERVEPEIDNTPLTRALTGAHMAWFQGMAAMDSQKWPLAIEDFERAISLWPSEPKFHRHISHAYAMAGRRGDAIAASEKSLAMNPNNRDYQLHRRNLG